MLTYKNVFFILFILIAVVSCKDDDPPIPNEEELITTVIYTLTPAGGGAAIEFTFRDLDGDGGNDPVIKTFPLDSGVVYTGALTLLNESETPAEDITEEIMEEDADHQFFFSVHQAQVTVSYEDSDDNGNPVGLQTELTTGAISQGHLTITLRHEPDKFAAGVSNGDITNAGGETDIEITFPIVIQ